MAKKLKISPVHLSFWCRTTTIDELVCERKGIAFDKDLALSLEEHSRYYFVIDKKGNFTTVSGTEFEAYFNAKDVELKDRVMAPECEMTPEAKKAIDSFIREVHKI